MRLSSPQMVITCSCTDAGRRLAIVAWPHLRLHQVFCGRTTLLQGVRRSSFPDFSWLPSSADEIWLLKMYQSLVPCTLLILVSVSLHNVLRKHCNHEIVRSKCDQKRGESNGCKCSLAVFAALTGSSRHRIVGANRCGCNCCSFPGWGMSFYLLGKSKTM